MNPTSAIPAAVAIALAFMMCAAIARGSGPPEHVNRFAPIDGLRGYLAMAVFLSHGCLWYFYLRSGKWVIPPSRLYAHFGEDGVALFFMITGFLFFSKLLDAKHGHIDWSRLMLSRLLRLGPAYWFAVCLLLSVVAYLSEGTLREPGPVLAKHLIEWLLFTVVGGPDVNGIKNTFTLMAGVTWSLPYELAFYGCLPLLALGIGMRPPLHYVFLGIFTALAFSWLAPDLYRLSAFAGGIIAAAIARSSKFCIFASGRACSFVVISGITVPIAFYPTARAMVPLVSLSVAFIGIACGNDLFGLLRHPASRILGEMAYSIYLLHGLVLFITFDLIIGVRASIALSPTMHWLVVIATTPLVVALCHGTFRFIEKPTMRQADRAVAWLRKGRYAFSRSVS